MEYLTGKNFLAAMAYIALAILLAVVNSNAQHAMVFFDHDQDTVEFTMPEITGVEIVTVIGYTSKSGSSAYNLALSKRRAEFVAQQIAKNHPEVAGINILWKGEEFAADVEAANDRMVIITFDVPEARVEKSHEFFNSGAREMMLRNKYRKVYGKHKTKKENTEELGAEASNSSFHAVDSMTTVQLQKANNVKPVKTILNTNNMAVVNVSELKTDTAMLNLGYAHALYESGLKLSCSMCTEDILQLMSIQKKFGRNRMYRKNMELLKKRMFDEPAKIKKRRRKNTSISRGGNWKRFRKGVRKTYIGVRTWINPYWNC